MSLFYKSNILHFFVLFFILWFSSEVSYSQCDTVNRNLSIEYNAYFGKIIKNYITFPDYRTSFLTGINFVKQTRGEKTWHRYYGFPKTGLMLLYGYNGNNQVFGRSISLIPNMSFYYRVCGLNLNLLVGLGFSYFNKPYNRITNPENVVVGSKITNATYAAITIQKPLFNRIDWKAGIAVMHFSNGHYQLPNVGMNVPLISAGLTYNFKTNLPQKAMMSKLDYYKKYVVNFRIGLGIHEFGYATKPTGGPKYPVYTAALYASKRLTYINTFQLGLMAAYYTDYYDYIVDQQVYDKNQKLKSSCFTVFVGHEYLLGRLGFVTQFGINIYHPFQRYFYEQDTDPMSMSNYLKMYNSNRLGVQYYLLNPLHNKRINAYLGVYIKAKFFSADFVEGAMGFSF